MSKDPQIMSMIDQRQRDLEQKVGLSVEKTLQEVARLAYSDPRKYFREDGTFKGLGELDDNAAAAIASIETDEIKADGKNIGLTRKFKMWDKNSALEKAMKFHGLFERDNEQQKPKAPDMDVVEIARRMAFCLSEAQRIKEKANASRD
jgi:phage terminase small subunit